MICERHLRTPATSDAPASQRRPTILLRPALLRPAPDALRARRVSYLAPAIISSSIARSRPPIFALTISMSRITKVVGNTLTP